MEDDSVIERRAADDTAQRNWQHTIKRHADDGDFHVVRRAPQQTAKPTETEDIEVRHAQRAYESCSWLRERAITARAARNRGEFRYDLHSIMDHLGYVKTVLYQVTYKLCYTDIEKGFRNEYVPGKPKKG